MGFVNIVIRCHQIRLIMKCSLPTSRYSSFQPFNAHQTLGTIPGLKILAVPVVFHIDSLAYQEQTTAVLIKVSCTDYIAIGGVHTTLQSTCTLKGHRAKE